MDINYELYKVFYFVAKTRSFSDASKELFISQSAVSQSIKVLEKRLNQTLFLRSTKKVSLTKEGELLFKHIEPAVHLIRQGENQILEANSLKGGQLRIGASDTICRYFLTPYFQAFHQSYPQVHIKVTNETSLKCVNLLARNKVDLIITNYPNSQFHPLLKIHKIKTFSDVFIANPEYYPIKKSVFSFEMLQDYPILMLERQSATSEFLHQLFLQRQLDLAPAIELSSNDLLLDFARIGLGIAFVPDYCVKSSSDLTILDIQETLPKRQLVAAYQSAIPLSEAASHFLESILSQEKTILSF